MYAYIRGKLTERNPAFAVLETNGIGYFLHISLNTYSLIGDKEECKLYVHQVVREDAHLLFGFADEEERALFRLLISVSGVGPNTAMMLLSSLKVNDLKTETSAIKIDLSHNRFREEALSGLIMLGFQKKAAEQAVDRVIRSQAGNKETDSEATLSVELLIREALKIL